MTDLLFYHLETRPLEKVLPTLLEKTLERGWRAVVEVGSRERVEALDAALWTYSDDSFLPHGVAMGGDADAAQPVILTDGRQNPNAASVRFFVDRATPRAEQGYDRLVYIFNGHDPDAVIEARGVWRALRETYSVTYWQQDAEGRWSKRA
ncbi:DNA polymerase III subunit chi [Pelagibacterium lacus]|uniref:DNA polymerase III subunit chi n=1 Tax=Pelagibacterium lacus TaxID=2282655 RepID=A0A369W945_9HYPH|nr:DNA polymerase III subunit chi [Pelagibacterium lacus]RDE09870.1 DNA polymerase III subunit chi [Pelagibacterium lacus]